MNAIKEFFFRRSLKRQKEKAIFEIGCDLEYIKQFKNDLLMYDESKARKRMAELKAIGEESRTEKEEQELDAVIDTISRSKAVKNEWEKSARLKEEVEDYVSIL